MTIKQDLKFFVKLFVIMFKISAFTFGGGLIIVSLMRKEFVEQRNWFSEQEMTDFIAIAQIAPGAIAINVAILVGRRIAGIPGMLVALTATVLPPLIILSVVTLFYSMFISNVIVQKVMKGMQAGIAAIIIDAIIKMIKPIATLPDTVRRISSVAIIILAFVSIAVFNVNVIIILVSAAIIGAVFFRGKSV